MLKAFRDAAVVDGEGGGGDGHGDTLLVGVADGGVEVAVCGELGEAAAGEGVGGLDGVGRGVGARDGDGLELVVDVKAVAEAADGDGRRAAGRGVVRGDVGRAVVGVAQRADCRLGEADGLAADGHCLADRVRGDGVVGRVVAAEGDVD